LTQRRDEARELRDLRDPRPGADVGRRRFLVALGSLPLVVPAALALAGCSGGEEAPATGGPGAAKPPPPAPPPAAPPPPAPAPAAQPPAPPPAAPPPPASGSAPADALVTEVEAMRPTVEALQYVHVSQKPDQKCTGCQFYTAVSPERGRCQLFQQGLVEAGGWCASWTARAPS
jgi:hypothetical protein